MEIVTLMIPIKIIRYLFEYLHWGMRGYNMKRWLIERIKVSTKVVYMHACMHKIRGGTGMHKSVFLHW